MAINPLRRELELRRRLFQSSPAWEPQPTNAPQIAAFNCTADEIGYGGAKGGGKSQLGNGMAMMRHHFTHCFRKNYEEHSAMLEIIKADFPPMLISNPPVYRPKVPRPRKIKARTIRFCHLENGDKDLRKYQGKGVDLLWIDEAVHFTRHQFEMLAADVRPLRKHELEADGVKCQVLLTFNPPLDMVGWWVVDFFAPWIDEKHPQFPTPYGKILHCCKIDGVDYFFEEGGEITHHPVTGAELPMSVQLTSRTFFRANLFDNEVYRHDKAYLARLQGMEEIYRRAFLEGEMSASLVDLAGQIIKRASWEAAVRRWPDAMKAVEGTPPLCISIDIASGGEDHFVCMPFWKYGHAGMPHGIEGKHVGNPQLQTAHVEQYIFDVLRTSPDQTAIIYDASGGWGSGFAEVWRTKYPTAQLIPFEGGKAAGINQIYNGIGKDEQLGELSGMPKASGPIGFQNRIGAAWYRAGEMLDHPMFQLAVPPHTRLAKEAQSRLVEERNGKVITIESKEKISKKLNHSPDYADAWVMGLWYLSVELRIVGKK